MLLLLALLFTLALLLVFFPRRKDPSLPPSPRALPFIGHLHLLGELPHESLLKLAKQYGGLMYLELGRARTLVASTPAAAKEVLKTHDRAFASRPANNAGKYFGYEATDMVWGPYGDLWRDLRKICTLEVFTVRRVQKYQPLRKQEMCLLLRDFVKASETGTPVDITSRLFHFSFNTMNRIVLNKSFSDATSVEAEEKDRVFLQQLNEASRLGSGLQLGDLMPWLRWADPTVSKIKKVQKHLDDYLQEQLEVHRKNVEAHREVTDFMDVLIAAGALDDTRIKALASDLLAAGTDTIALTLDWAMAELMRSPELMQAAKQELEEVVGKNATVEEEHIPKLPFLQAIVKETLRMHPPAPLLIPHESVEACNIWGYNIPSGTTLLVNAYALGRDESTWSEANKFDPQRFLHGNVVDISGKNFEVLPFGSGRRMCPGMNLGLTMVHYTLANMLHEFEWSFPDGYELDLKPFYGVVLLRDAPLMLIPRVAV